MSLHPKSASPSCYTRPISLATPGSHTCPCRSQRGGKRSYFKRTLDRAPEEVNGKPYLPGTIDAFADTLQVSCKFDGATLSGTLSKVENPVLITDGVLYERPTGDRSYWITCFPRAYFNGVLYESERETEVRGYAYCDHQFGNVNIQDFLDRWVW